MQFIAVCLAFLFPTVHGWADIVVAWGDGAEGKDCVFPFKFENKWYYDCITDAKSKKGPWCAVTEDFDTLPLKTAYCRRTECSYAMDNGESGQGYYGTVHTTNLGLTCQHWDENSPHAHSENIEDFPDDSFIEATNYCRNPVVGGKTGAWCYTTNDTVPTDLCTDNIPTCNVCTNHVLEHTTGDFENVTSSQLTASSFLDDGGVSANATRGKLNTVLDGTYAGGWCAKNEQSNEFIEIMHDKMMRIVGVETQGRSDQDYWTKTFKVKFTTDKTNWETIQDENNTDIVFNGNVDKDTVQANWIDEYTYGIRIYPQSWNTKPCLRFDIIGCQDDDTDCDSNNCQNGADCIGEKDRYFCDCLPGYVGKFCEINYDDCALNPCINGGACTDKVDDFECVCQGGYSGDLCEIASPTIHSCLDVWTSGFKTSGYYSMNLYNSTEPCHAEKLGDAYHLYQKLVAEDLGRTTDTDADSCRMACLTNSKCAGYTIRADGICYLTQYSNEIVPKSGYEAFTIRCPNAIPIWCDLQTPDWPRTFIPNFYNYDTLEIDGYESSNSFSRILQYAISKWQIDSLKYDSARCSQYMRYDCHGSMMAYGSLQHYDGTIQDADTGELCDCILDNVCIANNNDSTTECTCDYHNDYNWRMDDGTFRKKEKIPIIQMNFGDTGGSNEKAKVTLEPLICVQYNGVINECDSNPCQNAATCTDLHYGFNCTCEPGFDGVTCEININECASNPCENGGTCNDMVNGYNCTCDAGYTGTHCEIYIDDCVGVTCHNMGSCVDGVAKYHCMCQAGFDGDFCDTDKNECDSNPCENGGSCTNGFSKFTCNCTDAYEGIRCEINKQECDSNPCMNGAKCLDNIGQYSCSCADGYSGVHCEENINDCAKITCQNGGVCIDEVNSYTCDCPGGYDGTHCENNVDECASNPCRKGSTCIDEIKGYACKCASGYTGNFCEKEIIECESNPCQNGGYCTDGLDGYECKCSDGFTGLHCETNIDECEIQPCVNEGTCVDGVNKYTCTCLKGWTGTNCSLEVVDGQWSAWTGYECNVECGMGISVGNRKCDNPAPENGGKDCVGPAYDTKVCLGRLRTCPNINGQWATWEKWGACDRFCGEGLRNRTRTCTNPPPKGEGKQCEGHSLETGKCVQNECGKPVDGQWSGWSLWSACNKDCGLGVRRRERKCDDPPSLWGGEECDGSSVDEKPCDGTECPEFGKWKQWGQWTTCTSKCGLGVKTRKRSKSQIVQAGSMFIPVKYEYEHSYCVEKSCKVNQCTQCENTWVNMTTGKKELQCKGATKACPSDKPHCLYTFSKKGGNSAKKGCGMASTCRKVQPAICKLLENQTRDSIISDKPEPGNSLEPSYDTLNDMWRGLKRDEECNICCTESLCSTKLAPPGMTLLPESGAQSVTIATSWTMIITALMATVYGQL